MNKLQNIIRWIITSVLVIIFVVLAMHFLPGCISYPDKIKDETVECRQYRECLYYSAKANGKIDCSLVYSGCDKARVWKECSKGDLPTVYGNKGAQEMNFQECWDKRR